MAGKEEKVAPPSEELPVTETPPEAQTKTYTQEELDTATEAVRAEELATYQGIQRTIAKKDQEIASLKKQQGSPQVSNKALSRMLELLDTPTSDQFEVDPTRSGKISELKTELQREEQFEAMEKYAEGQREQLNQKIRDAGFDPTDDMFTDVDEAFDISMLDGKFDRAGKKLDRILKAQKPVEKKASEPNYEERLEEAKRQWMEEQGRLVSETGGPAGMGAVKEYTIAEVEKMTPEEYRAVFPTVADALKAQAEGRIK